MRWDEGEGGDKEGKGGSEEAEPPFGDQGDGGGGRWREAVEYFLEKLIAEDGIHFSRTSRFIQVVRGLLGGFRLDR